MLTIRNQGDWFGTHMLVRHTTQSTLCAKPVGLSGGLHYAAPREACGWGRAAHFTRGSADLNPPRHTSQTVTKREGRTDPFVLAAPDR